MKKKIADLWIEALESGKYKQGVGRLFDGANYCCLGVLCDLYRKETGSGEWNENNEFEILNTANKSILLGRIKKWAGLLSSYGRLPRSSLVYLNDSGKSFEQIAETIKNNYKEL